MSIFLLDYNCQLWVVGRNESGQLGLGDRDDRDIPEKITLKHSIGSNTPAKGRIWEVSCGDSHSVIIDGEGSPYMSGSNNKGQFGIDNIIETNSFVAGSHCMFKSVRCCRDYTLGLDNIGRLFECGYNHISDTEPINFWRELSNCGFESFICGYNYIVAIDFHGFIWSCGDNECGQLGLGDRNYRKVFVKIQSPKISDRQYNPIDTYRCTRTKHGTITIKTVPLSYTDKGEEIRFKQVSRSDYHMVAIDTSGCLWGCGLNTSGQLGSDNFRKINHLVQIERLRNIADLKLQDAKNIRFSSVCCMPHVTIALDARGDLYVSGDWECSQELDNPNYPKFSYITAGDVHLFAIDTTGNLWVSSEENVTRLVRKNIDIKVKKVIVGPEHKRGMKTKKALHNETN